MQNKQITFHEFVGTDKPLNSTIQNNTECYWVPSSKDGIFSNLLRKKASTDMEASFLRELKIATRDVSNIKSFFVPLYAATCNATGNIVTSPEYKPECNYSLQMWEESAQKFGYEIGEYYQLILWLATIVNDLMGCERMPFNKAVITIHKNAEKPEDKVHTCKLMRLTNSATESAVVTGINEKGLAYGKNIFYNRKINNDSVITASPFLIIPKM